MNAAVFAFRSCVDDATSNDFCFVDGFRAAYCIIVDVRNCIASYPGKRQMQVFASEFRSENSIRPLSLHKQAHMAYLPHVSSTSCSMLLLCHVMLLVVSVSKQQVFQCRLYPYYVTGDMVSDWGTHTRNGQTVNWDASRSMQLHDPDVRQRHHDWGQQGASSSFGGGGGYGGGGTGGSW